jgi:glutaminase
VGDTEKQFCIQSCSKPISYLIGLNSFGTEYVHNHVGTEPSGHAFNYMGLKDAPDVELPNKAIPHNPYINAGAIMMCSMVYPEVDDRQERLDRVLD